MGSSPIARSIFFKVFLSSLLLASASVARAQGAFPEGDDPAVDFRLSGMTFAVQDFPQRISGFFPGTLSPSLRNESLFSLDYPNGSGPSPFSGRFDEAPAIFFDGVQFPMDPKILATWITVPGTRLAADFPTQALVGAFQGQRSYFLGAPSPDAQGSYLGAMGGAGNHGSIFGHWTVPDLSVGGSLQHAEGKGGSPVDTWTLLSHLSWRLGPDLGMESGFLGAQWIGKEQWIVLYQSAELSLDAFQGIGWKPYFQTSGQEGSTVREIGSQWDYHLDVAGLLRSITRLEWSSISSNAFEDRGRAAVQNTEWIDGLGIVNVVFSFREEIPSGMGPFSNLLLGVRGRVTDDWALVGDYQTAGSAPGDGSQTAEIGTEVQFDPKIAARTYFFHRYDGAQDRDGFRMEWSLDRIRPPFLAYRPITLLIGGEALLARSTDPAVDAILGIRWELLDGVEWWARTRKTSGQVFLADTGVKIAATSTLRFSISLTDLGDLPLEDPDPYVPNGLAVQSGLEGHF